MYLKFCGFKRKEDVLKAIELPIDAIGFIHFPNSHRHRDMSQIQQLTKLVPSYIDRVVVLVNPDRTQIQSVVSHIASGIEINHQKDGDKMKTIVNIVKGE